MGMTSNSHLQDWLRGAVQAQWAGTPRILGSQMAPSLSCRSDGDPGAKFASEPILLLPLNTHDSPFLVPPSNPGFPKVSLSEN